MLQSAPGGTVYLLKRAELATRSCVEVALADSGLTPTQFLTLLRLKLEGGLSSAALARALGVQPQSIAEIVKPLERKGFIERSAGAEHHRSLHITLTSRGKRALAKAMRVANRLEKELLDDLSAQELRVLRRALEKLRVRAETHDLHPGSRRTAV
jgi:DNA-binding MarR family transcriptional regulator